AEYTNNFSMEQPLADWLLVKRLIKERNRFVTDANPDLFLTWADTDADLPNRLESIINDYKKKMFDNLNALPECYSDIRDRMVGKLNCNFATTSTIFGKKDE